MFSFISEFLNDVDVKSEKTQNNFKFVSFNGEVFYLQNFKDIISFNDEFVVVKLNSGELEICGQKLKINEISQKFICISGKINKVEVRNV